MTGRLLLAVALVAALLRLPATERTMRDETRAGRAVRYEQGVPVLPSAPEGLNALLAAVARDVPGRVPVRLVVHGVSCTRLPVLQGGGLQYWLQYRLLPHPLSCDPAEPWQVHVLGPPPPGAETYGPEAALVRP